jgi:hypothetical protein
MPPIFDIHNRGINWNYRRATSNFTNKYLGGEWRCDEEWYLRVGLDDKAFDVTNIYYDGHTHKSITFLWIQIGYGYGYDSRPVSEWQTSEEK